MIVDSISGTLDGFQNGAFLITEVQVTFAGLTNFTGNNGTVRSVLCTVLSRDIRTMCSCIIPRF